MRKLLIGIFAHPDDEAFGPAGTLFKLKDDGYDIHLILLTDGEGGTNPDNVADLGAVRTEEWQEAAALLGAASTHALHYPDGRLEILPEIELEEIVRTSVADILSNYTEPVQLSFMTLEPHGLTGHHDHIVASRLTADIAPRFNARSLWYYCLDKTKAPLDNTAYYEPRAREDEFINTRVDVSAYLANKYRMMDAHHSQRADAATMKAPGDELLSTECFQVVSY